MWLLSGKAQDLFLERPGNLLVLVHMYLKMEEYIHLKLLVWREPVLILRIIMWIKQLCHRKLQDFTMAFWAWKVSRVFEKWTDVYTSNKLVFVTCEWIKSTTGKFTHKIKGSVCVMGYVYVRRNFFEIWNGLSWLPCTLVGCRWLKLTDSSGVIKHHVFEY